MRTGHEMGGRPPPLVHVGDVRANITDSFVNTNDKFIISIRINTGDKTLDVVLKLADKRMYNYAHEMRIYQKVNRQSVVPVVQCCNQKTTDISHDKPDVYFEDPNTSANGPREGYNLKDFITNLMTDDKGVQLKKAFETEKYFSFLVTIQASSDVLPLYQYLTTGPPYVPYAIFVDMVRCLLEAIALFIESTRVMHNDLHFNNILYNKTTNHWSSLPSSPIHSIGRTSTKCSSSFKQPYPNPPYFHHFFHPPPIKQPVSTSTLHLHQHELTRGLNSKGQDKGTCWSA